MVSYDVIYATQWIMLTFRCHPVGSEDLVIVHEGESYVREIKLSSQVLINLKEKEREYTMHIT